MKPKSFLLILGLIFSPILLVAQGFESWKDLEIHYKKNNFDPITITEKQLDYLPILSSVPADFDQLQDVDLKKKLFYLIVLPLIHESNRQILLDREMIINIEKKFLRKDLNENELQETIRLAKKYKLDYSEINLKLFRDLKQRINVIPVSLALAQAIVESGWGQSRFALEGNALYGQWTTNELKGIVPEDRDEDKSHAVRKFDNLTQSVQAYMHNINTHGAYYSFRVVRRIAERVQYTDPVSAKVKFLAAYAEIGREYVDKLELIIESNNLREFDRFSY
ncbi:glucosaminidase domain-containing protein [Alphaproteobacteria bacterium]|nr:glucosaminidase domain-containing protein [Alphaproteobacteria bacterium]